MKLESLCVGGYIEMITLTIPGEPVAKGRPRVCKFGTYTPVKTVNYETLIKELFIISKQDQLQDMLSANIKCYFKIPKATSKKNKVLIDCSRLRPTKKPDLDNLAKICLDALNGLAYDDDSQIVELTVSKWYSNEPRVEIEISEVE